MDIKKFRRQEEPIRGNSKDHAMVSAAARAAKVAEELSASVAPSEVKKFDPANLSPKAKRQAGFPLIPVDSRPVAPDPTEVKLVKDTAEKTRQDKEAKLVQEKQAKEAEEQKKKQDEQK